VVGTVDKAERRLKTRRQWRRFEALLVWAANLVSIKASTSMFWLFENMPLSHAQLGDDGNGEYGRVQ